MFSKNEFESEKRSSFSFPFAVLPVQQNTRNNSNIKKKMIRKGVYKLCKAVPYSGKRQDQSEVTSVTVLCQLDLGKCIQPLLVYYRTPCFLPGPKLYNAINYLKVHTLLILARLLSSLSFSWYGGEQQALLDRAKSPKANKPHSFFQ